MVDDAGCLRIVGRSKDMFIVGGFNAYPAEIENALLRHPDIQQAAVIGIPDERLGEVGMAFVVARPGASTPATRSSRGAASRWPTTRCRAPSSSSTSCPLNATGKVDEGRAAGPGGRAATERRRWRARLPSTGPCERAAADAFGDRAAVLAGDERWSFGDLDGLSNALRPATSPAAGVGARRPGRGDD